jgi:hypothetical protein
MACPVCFGGEDPVVRESLNAGIGVLLGVTGVVLACLGRFIVVLRHRAQFADQVDFTVPTSTPPETGFASSVPQTPSPRGRS